MSALSRLLRDQAGNQLAFWCPGCGCAHSIRVGEGERPCWQWNGDAERPTFTPSILVTGGHFASSYKPGDPCWCTYNAEHPDDPVKFGCQRCHSYVTDGFIQFLDDSSHELKGQTVPLPAWPGETEQL